MLNTKGYSILDPEGGGMEKKLKIWEGGSGTKIKHCRGSGEKKYEGGGVRQKKINRGRDQKKEIRLCGGD